MFEVLNKSVMDRKGNLAVIVIPLAQKFVHKGYSYSLGFLRVELALSKCI